MKRREPKIAGQLRKYLHAVGPRGNPVRVTERQLDQLLAAGLVVRSADRVYRFNGQALELHEHAAAQYGLEV
jgi:hypothetical protein